MTTDVFGYTGVVQQWTCPADIAPPYTVALTLVAAGGGGTVGGHGALVTGNFTATPGRVYYVVVPGAGITSGVSTPTAGGWSGDGVLTPVATGGGIVSGGSAGSGGGAAFVVDSATGSIVAVAGGGGGQGGASTAANQGGAGLGGNPSTAGGAGAGGTAADRGGGGGAANGTTAGTAGTRGTGGTGTVATAGSGGGISTVGTSGAGGSGGSTVPGTSYGGGGAGGGYAGGGGGGGASVSVSQGGGGGAGGSCYVGGLTGSVITQGGGSAGSTAGQISFTYNQSPLAPTVFPIQYGKGPIIASLPALAQWNSVDPDVGDYISYSNLRYRLIGAGSWTTISNLAPKLQPGDAGIGPNGETATGYYIFPANTLAAGNYEYQVQTADSSSALGPWSASVDFTVLSTPALAFPFADLPDQWPNNSATPHVYTAADMHAKIDVPLSAIAQLMLGAPAVTYDPDPTRQAFIAVSAIVAGTGQTVAVGKSPIFGEIDAIGDYPILDYNTGKITIPMAGMYWVNWSICHANAVFTTWQLTGLPNNVASVKTFQGTAGWTEGIAQLVRFNGGEVLQLIAGATVNITGAGSTHGYGSILEVWRVGP